MVTLIISLITVFLVCRPNVNRPNGFGPKEVEPSVVGIFKTFFKNLFEQKYHYGVKSTEVPKFTAVKPVFLGLQIKLF